MSDPTPYIVSYSFSGFQASNPTTPLPAPALDNELANIAASIATIDSAIESVRRSDGALQNGIVTFASLASSLQLTIDPTNGTLVAAAVATAQAAQTAASGSAAAAAGSAAAATTQAANAAASAGSVNLALYLPKAGNLAGIGSPDTARSNISAAKIDASDMIGRLAPSVSDSVGDWNNFRTSGWFAGTGMANAPGAGYWLLGVISYGALYVTQVAYPFTNANAGTSAVTPYRRHSYDSGGGVVLWSAWEGASPVPVGTTIWVNGLNVPPGFLQENGGLVSRATYPALYAFAAASGNIVSEALWSVGHSGGFSTGDLATTFRLPDSRGEFIRGYDGGRGVDAGRVIGSNQADMLKDHTHTYQQAAAGAQKPNGTGSTPYDNSSAAASGSASIGGAETRPRNIAKMPCIKF